MAAIKLGKYYITKNDPRFLLRKVAELTDENQKLKEMQCTFQGTGCQRKMKKYKEVINKAIEYINEYAWQEDFIGDMYTTTGKPIVDKYMQLEQDNCNELLDILKEVG